MMSPFETYLCKVDLSSIENEKQTEVWRQSFLRDFPVIKLKI